MQENDKLVIIDGNSLVNRAFYAIQRPMITKDGFYTQGIYGFLSMLAKIRNDYNPTHMLVAFDRKAPTFRHLEYSEYKAGRRKMPVELAMELPVLKEVLSAMGIRMFEVDGFEADDIIGTTARMADEASLPAYIITGDKDALQLATDNTSVIITKKGISEFKLYDDASMVEEYGFDHLQFIDFKALRGDSSDNIPGIPGVGDKTATALIQQFGSLENLLKNTDQISSKSLRAKVEDNAMSAMMSKRLATIVTSVPVDYSLEDCRIKTEDTNALIDLYTKLEFKTYLNKLLKNKDASAYAELNSDIDIHKEFNFKNAELITEPDKASLLLNSIEGSVLIDIATDNSHTSIPSLDCVELLYCDKCYCITVPGLGQLLAESFGGKKLKLSGFNLGRIYYLLLSYGCDISGLETAFDCAIAQYVLSPSTSAPGLDALILSEFHENIGNDSKELQLDLFAAGPDVSISGKKLLLLNELCRVLADKIKAEELEYILYDIELPLCRVLADMEYRGITVDAAALKDYGSQLLSQISVLENEIIQLAGESFNINSPMQLGDILFGKLGLPAGKKTKKGYSTSADILEKLAPDYPIVEKVLEFRTLSKLRSTYVEGMLPLISPDAKVRCHFQQTVTATGRISCTEPNLQNIPVRKEPGKSLRKVFGAEEGCVLVGADYSQIELRVLAHMSEDPTLIKCFNDGLDIHRETASKVFGVPQEDVTSQMRSAAKAVNFGVIYGMSGFGLASELTISQKQAQQYIADYFGRFPMVKQFMNDNVARCKADGCIRTLYGRKRNVPEITASAFKVRQLGERLAMNTPIQGTAADIIKLAMVKVYKALKEQCPNAHLILQIHDELIINTPEAEAEKVAEILKECMENAASLLVKLEVSESTAYNWYNLK